MDIILYFINRQIYFGLFDYEHLRKPIYFKQIIYKRISFKIIANFNF